MATKRCCLKKALITDTTAPRAEYFAAKRVPRSNKMLPAGSIQGVFNDKLPCLMLGLPDEKNLVEGQATNHGTPCRPYFFLPSHVKISPRQQQVFRKTTNFDATLGSVNRPSNRRTKVRTHRCEKQRSHAEIGPVGTRQSMPSIPKKKERKMSKSLRGNAGPCHATVGVAV